MAGNLIFAQNPHNPGTGNNPRENLCRAMMPDSVPWYSRGEWVEECAYGPSQGWSTEPWSTEPWIDDYLAGPGLKLFILAVIVAGTIAVLKLVMAVKRRRGVPAGLDDQVTGFVVLGMLTAGLYLAWDGYTWGRDIRWSIGSALVAIVVGVAGSVGLMVLLLDVVADSDREGAR